MEIIRRKLEFSNMLTVDCVGKSGGLALLWGDETKVEIQNYSQRHINGIVRRGKSHGGLRASMVNRMSLNDTKPGLY
jgi:hypothetical protein